METKEQKKLNLYDHIKMFLDDMNKQFPDGCDESTVFIIASNGKKISSLFGGDDSVMRDMISYVALKDDEIRNIVGDALLGVIDLSLIKHSSAIS